MSTSATLTTFLGIPFVVLLTIGIFYLARHSGATPEKQKKIRATGIAYPWDKWQILVVSITLYNVFVFYAVVARAMSTGAEVVLDILESGLLVVTISLWIYLSVTDPCIAKTKDAIGNEFWCRFCQSYYAGEKRKHCRHCKKCVIGFDHHCFFLNTCIADHNYKQFLVLLSTYVAVLTLQVLGVATALARYIDNDADSEPFGDVGVQFFLWTSLVVSFPSWCGAGALLCLHIFFVVTGTNTFKWLKQDYEEEKIRAKLKAYEESYEQEMRNGLSALSASSNEPAEKAEDHQATAEANPVAAEPSGIVETADSEMVVEAQTRA
eukprot:TRINITY_DN2124_c0_g1_i1.p1 TRINITY_DN2124_c0_g1~~TRINITY_DN2124_c0_g1_i1.p1  ORF type:complete len:322 (+),score=63.74 TRINITY_DN2124_c0_g1_i1:196-1161(+)